MEINIGRYRCLEDYTIMGLVTKENPTGDGSYTPFGKEVLPFWGVMCSTFEGLNQYNKKFIMDNLDENENEITIRLRKYWLFWFADGDLNNQKELFFHGPEARTQAYKIQHLFNSLHEHMIDTTLKDLSVDISNLEG